MRLLLAALAALAVLASAPAHATCLIAGDSIAVDLGKFVAGCTVDAQVGIGSAAIVARVKPARTVVISAGSNDPDNPHLAANLRAMRANAGGTHPIWIVPVNATAAAAVLAVARPNHDPVVPFVAARDRVHPKCPRCLAQFIFGSASTGE